MLVLLALLLVTPARAAEPTAEAEAVAQIRHDLWGEPYLPLWSYLRLRKEVHGEVAYGYGVDAYVGLEWAAGLDRPSDLDLYSLELESEQPWGRWVVGRQRAFAALRPQTFDGLRVDWRPTDALALALWGGEARHQDLDDLRDGVHMGRLEATVHERGLVARVGAQVETGPETPLVARQDVEGRAQAGGEGLHPDVLTRLVVAEATSDDGGGITPAVELARVEVGVRPVSSLRTSLHAEHREAADPEALFGEAILESLAGGAVNLAGAAIRLSGARFAALHGRWSLVSYGPDETTWYGHEVDLRWAGGVVDKPWRLSPGYTFRAGPGGLFHAPSLAGQLDLSDRAQVGARGALVPYRKLSGPWELVATASLDGALQPTPWMGLSARLDASSDALLALDLRGTAALTLAVP